VSVASTSGYLAADLILISKSNDPATVDYTLTANWHVTTIASVTNGTDFVIADAIPVGDGTYASGVGYVKRARFKNLPVVS
jgi:hypothetical protein